MCVDRRKHGGSFLSILPFRQARAAAANDCGGSFLSFNVFCLFFIAQRFGKELRPARFSWFSKNSAAAFRVEDEGTSCTLGFCVDGSVGLTDVTFSSVGAGGVSKFCKI